MSILTPSFQMTPFRRAFSSQLLNQLRMQGENTSKLGFLVKASALVREGGTQNTTKIHTFCPALQRPLMSRAVSPLSITT